MKTRSTLLLILAACCSTSVQAVDVFLPADRDTTIYKDNADKSNGGGAGIFVGNNGGPSPRRGFISFDLSSIPAGSIINSVQLTLTLGVVAGTGASTPKTIGLYALTSNWGEGDRGNATDHPTGISGSGGGFTAATGDATWNAAFYSPTTPTAWLTAGGGGDHAASPSASLTITGGGTAGAAYSWASTSPLITDVQVWLNSPSTNFGWELINTDETTAQTALAFYSSEWHTFTNGNAGQEPVLQVTYATPEPATGSLASIAALVLLSLRPSRRRG